MIQRPRATSAAALGLALLLGAESARAQFGPTFGGGGPTGGNIPQRPPPTQSSGPKKPANMPETHAASGASESLVPPGQEPTLPDKPLELKPSVASRIGSDAALDEPVLGRGPITRRKPYGLYYEERSGRYRLRTLFPLWFERKQPSAADPSVTDRASLFGGFYYNRRSATHADDVLFPVFWNLRAPATRTTIVGPFVNRVAPHETDNWLAPLYFQGKRKSGRYFAAPPLLTYMNNTGRGGLNVIGPAFCSWDRGESCDPRTNDDVDLGLAPLYFYGKNKVRSYESIPPLFHYHHEDTRDLSSLDVWGPYFRKHTEKEDKLHVFPLYFSLWGEKERHTTLFPFFHYGHDEESTLFINPLYLRRTAADGDKTFITWGYARHRGRTELDMVTPLFWHFRDPDAGVDEKLVFPFLYSKTSPREADTVFFPFFGHFERYGISETTWITPLFRHSHDLRGWSTAINPLFYIGRNGYSTHMVAFPFFWDFASPRSRTTIGAPVYWRFSDERTMSQLIGNVYYRERKVSYGLDWELHVFPLFSYGETPNGHWWNILYGLAGYTRRGENVQVRTLWIPIDVAGEL